MKTIGYIVTERCDEFEQVLTLRTGEGLPPGGILAWADKPADPRHVFPDRASASKAITRTDHYGKAFAPEQHPEKRFCVIAPLRATES